MTSSINVGDKVLFVERSGRQFEACEVLTVAKASFTISKELKNGRTAPFRFNCIVHFEWSKALKQMNRPYHEAYRPGKYGSEKWYRVYPDTPAMREELQKEYEDAKNAEAIKDAERERREDERAQQLAAEMKAVKDAFGCMTDDEMPPARVEYLPDGGRLYVIAMPVKPEYADRKKGWERVIVRCWDDMEVCFDRGFAEAKEITITRSACTYCNGDSGSFSSVSICRYRNDHEAVWDACRSQYNHW